VTQGLYPNRIKVVSVQGIVDRIWHNQRADGSEFWVLSIDGQRYSTWDKNLVASVQEGDSVEFAFTESGRYRNLTALKRTGASAFTTADKLRISPESLRIVRMNCLRNAAEMLKDTTLLPEQKVALAINMAQELENHVLRPLDNCPEPELTENGQDDQGDGRDQEEGGV